MGAASEAERQSGLVAATWTVFDRIVRAAPAALAKGPRGGGRDRDAIVDHVLGNDTVYARKIGIRERQPGAGDAAAIAALRTAILDALGTAQGGSRPGDVSPRLLGRLMGLLMLAQSSAIAPFIYTLF